jgi:hypothetical protein
MMIEDKEDIFLLVGGVFLLLFLIFSRGKGDVGWLGERGKDATHVVEFMSAAESILVCLVYSRCLLKFLGKFDSRV